MINHALSSLKVEHPHIRVNHCYCHLVMLVIATVRSGYRPPRIASLPAVKTPIAQRTRDCLPVNAVVYLNTAQRL